MLKRKRLRPILNRLDRLFWTGLRRCWTRWAEVLVIVKPETVIGWHRAGFRLYGRWRSRPRGGRPKITEEIRELIRRLAQENSNWGAPKIHGELSNSASRSRNGRWLVICGGWGPVAIRLSGGAHFSKTIVKSSWPSTSSPYRL